MTCIVGIRSRLGRVLIGGDRAGVGSSLGLDVRRDVKVFRRDASGGHPAVAMGFTTSFRMGQLLRYRFNPPRLHSSEDLMTYMVTEFVDAVRKSLKEGGYASKEKEAEHGGTFLVGLAGRLFTIYDDYQVAESESDFAAVGCAQDVALGSLYSTEREPSLTARALTALRAAERFSGGVRGPFDLVEIPSAEDPGETF